VRLRDQIDIDSMDALNFLIAIDAEMRRHCRLNTRSTTLDNIVESCQWRWRRLDDRRS
jgi:hypothetical protein